MSRCFQGTLHMEIRLDNAKVVKFNMMSLWMSPFIHILSNVFFKLLKSISVDLFLLILIVISSTSLHRVNAKCSLLKLRRGYEDTRFSIVEFAWSYCRVLYNVPLYDSIKYGRHFKILAVRESGDELVNILKILFLNLWMTLLWYWSSTLLVHFLTKIF